MSGLVPSEQTTGEQRRLGAITKTGSGHARRLLVEAAWHYRKRPAIGRALTDRQAGQPALTIAMSRVKKLRQLGALKVGDRSGGSGAARRVKPVLEAVR
jgi:transposase